MWHDSWLYLCNRHLESNTCLEYCYSISYVMPCKEIFFYKPLFNLNLIIGHCFPQVIIGSKELIDLNLGVGEASTLLKQASHEEAALQVNGEKTGEYKKSNCQRVYFVTEIVDPSSLSIMFCALFLIQMFHGYGIFALHLVMKNLASSTT